MQDVQVKKRLEDEPMTQITIPNEIAERAQNFAGRLWVLEEVNNWLDERSERFLLITGEPGSGKTALAAWLAGAGPNPADDVARRKLEALHGRWGAVHFCVAEDQRGTLHPSRFAQSLARQLSDRYDQYGKAVIQRIAPSVNISQEARENWGRMIGAQIGTLIIQNANMDDIYNVSVREPLEELFKLEPDLEILILVDGMDEAQSFYQPNQPNIVDLLAGSGDLPKGVRFVLTSREEPKVTERFRQAYQLNLSDQSEQRICDNDRDISEYVKHRLLGTDMKPHFSNVPSLEAIVEAIVQRAAGNFLYVKFVLDGVVAQRHSLADVPSLPHGLYGVYRAYMNRLVPEMTQQGRSEVWEKKLQPLLGRLSVAIPAAPREVLPNWLGQDDGSVMLRLAEVRQITEDISAVENDRRLHHRLYHRSMAEFLAADVYVENENNTPNRYYTAPRQQHEAIVHYYIDNFHEDWRECDIYGLRQLVSHIRSWLILEKVPKARQEIVKTLYAVVLDSAFRTAQIEKLGNTNSTLADLRTALDIALARDDWAKVLACVGAYRETIARMGISRPIFEAVDRNEFNVALQAAERYAATSDWGQILCLYVAWEAAEAAQVKAEDGSYLESESYVELAEKAFTASQRYSLIGAGELGDALLVRTAQALAMATQDIPQNWLDRFGRNHNANWLLERYDYPAPVEEAERAGLLKQAEKALQQLMVVNSEMLADGMEMLDFVRGNLTGNLVRLAAEQEGQDNIDNVLRRVVTNPYPQYRNIGLAALGVAALAVPTKGWSSIRLRHILRAKLDSEGVTFTFDLPAILLAEAERRQIQAQNLAAYLEKAVTVEDSWGTASRAYSARAAAHYWQRDTATALDEMTQAGQRAYGYAGYEVMNLLSFVNRSFEFGQPDFKLLERAESAANQVMEDSFRARRMRLVEDYNNWIVDYSPPASELQTVLGALSDQDTQQAYIEHLSARWADPKSSDRENIKLLLPYTLFAGTTLDTLLGRLIGPQVAQLSDDDLEEAIHVCETHLVTGRPWELGQWR